MEDLGVIAAVVAGAASSDDELEDGGRGIVVIAGVVLTILAGLEDEVLAEVGVVSLGLEGVVGGVALTEFVRLVFSAAR